MNRLIIVAGLILGGMLGLAIVTLNPLSLMATPPAPGTPALALSYTPAEFRGFELTPLALLGIAGIGAGGAGFTDPAIQYVSISIAPVTSDANAAVGLAVRMSSAARRNSIARARLGVMTNMNIAWPDQGSLFLAGSENFWAIARDCLWSFLRGHGFIPAPESYALLQVPGAGTGQAVTGARGALAGAHGAYSESFEPAPGSPNALAGKRRLYINELR
jgi:hypothetical protein